MIFGVGIDILQAERVETVYRKYGDHFVRRILMAEEIELFSGQKRPERFLAMRFAAKEAVVKAMGTGFANGMWVRDTGVIPNRYGRPEIIFSGRGRSDQSALCAVFVSEMSRYS